MVYSLNVRPEWGFDPKRDWDGKNDPARRILALDPVDDGGVVWNSHNSGVPVDGGNFPRWVRWADPNGNPVPDFDSIPYLSVSERAKQAIESLEAGVHQFFPVDYQDSNGRHTSTRYWFVPCNRIDSADRDHTNMVLRKGLEWCPPKDMLRRGEPIPSNVDPGKPSKLVLNLAAIGDHHIWRDKHITSSQFISDAMASIFQQEGLTGIRLDDRAKEEAV